MRSYALEPLAERPCFSQAQAAAAGAAGQPSAAMIRNDDAPSAAADVRRMYDEYAAVYAATSRHDLEDRPQLRAPLGARSPCHQRSYTS